MFVDVKSFFFHSRLYTDTPFLVQNLQTGETEDKCPCSGHQSAECLDAEETETSTVEKSSVCGEDTGKNGSKDSADAVYRDCTDRIVDLEHLVDESYGADHCAAAEESDHCGTTDGNHVTACRDADQTGKHAVADKGKGWLSIDNPGKEEYREASDGSCHVRGADDVRDCDCIVGSVCGELGTRVEAEPSEPEDEHTESTEGEIVSRDSHRFAGFVVLAASRTKNHTAGKGDYATDGVNYGRACEVMEGKG